MILVCISIHLMGLATEETNAFSRERLLYCFSCTWEGECREVESPEKISRRHLTLYGILQTVGLMLGVRCAV